MVIDRIGLGQLIDLTGGIDLGTGLTSSVNAISSLTTPEGNPQAAVLSQAHLLESLCSQTADLAVLDTAKMVDLLARHVRSDYTPEQIIASWQSFQTSGVRFSCDFPTLGAFGSQVLQPPQASLIPQPNP